MSPVSRATYSTNESARSSLSTCRRSNGIAARNATASRETTSRMLGASATRRAIVTSISAGSAFCMVVGGQYNRSNPTRRDTCRVPMVFMSTLSHGLSWVDLRFLGRSNVIASGVIESAAGVAIVDPGPTSCLETLELDLQGRGIRWPDVRHILLTHIHLDHAGATGTIVRAHPHVTVYVHESGTRHLVDPKKLVDSATRLYGDQMDRLWGEFAAVPVDRIVSLAGGERIDAGGRPFDVAYTPGHASHHVSFFDASSGVAFVGDTAGVSVDGGYVLPPTPPPDIDLEAWAVSV